MARVHVGLPADRLRLLIAQLLEEGLTKTDVANRLGIGATIINKLEEEPNRGVYSETLTKVIHSLDLDANYFFAVELGSKPLYSDHIRHSRDRELPHWKEFLANYTRVAELSDDDRQRLRAVVTDAHEITSWRSWASLASWYLDHRPEP